MIKTNNYCGDSLQQADPDRFLLTLVVPQVARVHLWALFAFNAEIAKTRSVVSDTTIGLIRLTWWREQIATLYGGATPPAHEILNALDKAIRAHDLPQEDFDALIYAREFDLENQVPETLEGLCKYAAFTSLPLMRLCAKVLRIEIDEAHLHDLAVGYALAGILRAVPFHAQQQQCFLPRDILARYGITPEQVFTGQAALSPVIAQVRDTARIYLDRSQPAHRFLKAHRVLAHLSLKATQRDNSNPFSAAYTAPIPFKLLWIYLG